MAGARTVLKDVGGEGGGYTPLVALTNQERVDQLMRTATDLADGEVVVVSVIHKPVTSPFLLFSEGQIRAEFDDGQPSVLERAAAAAGEVPVRRHLLVGSDVSAGIMRAAEESGADALLLGWQDRPRPADIVLGRTVDRVVARAPCDVFVERVGTTADGMDAILLPTVGGPHLRPATDLASAVAEANGAAVTAVSYVERDAGGRERAAARERVETAAEMLPEADVESVVEPAADVASTIVRRADEHDLVVLGATRERTLRRRVVGSVAETVAREATPPVVIAKCRSDRSLLGRVFGW
jgi:nucleotide-binding universal stress UspA family protein